MRSKISSDYIQIILRKKNGKFRNVSAPEDDLKQCQRKILHHIIAYLPISNYAKAYVKGNSLTHCASPHVGKKYLLKLDIADFFGSISFEKVYSTAFHTKYFPKQIGAMLTTLCCRNDVLPQGAPTSPALSNLVMRNFDQSIGCWCEKHEIFYTRYCDDMTFSSNQPLFVIYRKAKVMLEEMGFTLNQTKTHFITHANRQSVTGLTVNEKVSVSNYYKRKLRQEMYYVLKFGLEDSMQYTSYNDPQKHYHHLVGKLNFVLQIEPNLTWFRKALEEMTKRYGL